MSNASGATGIAIIVGAGVGALAAFLAGAPGPPAVEAPGSTPTRNAAPARIVPSPTAEPSGPAPRTTVSTTPVSPSPSAGESSAAPAAPTPKVEPSELDQLPLAELEKRCSLRQPKACLASARAFDSGRGVAPDAVKARLYRSLALSLLDERCFARDAESCHDLAGLHQHGTGTPKNPATAAALGQRARELCAGKTTSFCERLGATPGGE